MNKLSKPNILNGYTIPLLVAHLIVGSLFVFLELEEIFYVCLALILITITALSQSLWLNVLSAAVLIGSLWLGYFNQSLQAEISAPRQAIIAVFMISGYFMGASFAGVQAMTTRRLEEETSAASLERHRLRSLINSMADGVIATDETGQVMMYNGAALAILNINVSLESQNLGDFLKLIDSKDRPVNVMELANSRTNHIISRDYRIMIDDQELINLYLSLAPVKISYGREGQQGYIVLLRDITKDKSLEEERDEFISVVSHELRTPVTIAEGNISNAKLVIKRSDINNPAINKSLDAAHKQAVYLADMINDLATLSRAERGVIQFDPENIDAAELVMKLVDEYSIDAGQKGLVLKSAINGDVGNLVSSRLYVREVLQNFITNSIKYTEQGSITLEVAQPPGGDQTVFKVKDTGIGISKTDQKMLFRKFFRSEDFRTRQNNGTGLGLYITAKLAHLIKAEIDVSSEINKGSTFTITVPNLKLHHNHHDAQQ